MKRFLLVLLALPAAAFAAPMRETLLETSLGDSVTQAAVLSLAGPAPTYLAVLLPGSPSVLRPVLANDEWSGGRLMGNFLIRSRKWLVDEDLAVLSVDCRSDSGDECRELYQASQQRFIDVKSVIELAKSNLPSIRQVWLVGTSMGTISSTYMAKWGGAYFAGAIHTASINNGLAYRSMANPDFAAAGIPQVFIHHRDDPCRSTTYDGTRHWSEKFSIPLITVTGGSGFSGNACQAFSQHGFRGVEREVMAAIAAIIKSGKVEQSGIAPAN